MDVRENAGVERVGVVLVHGIGEQRRFEHLDWQGRDIIKAIAAQLGAAEDMTVEIGSHAAASFHDAADTWDGGADGAVRAYVRTGGKLTHCFHFHEVWWADVNERYSISKQIRFWLWGLAIWAYPRNGKVPLHGNIAVTSPVVPGRDKFWPWLWQGLRLFMVGVLFLLGGFSVGTIMAVLQRLLNLKTPNLLKTAANYVSGVKLFNQASRLGPAFSLNPPNDDFLDTLNEPPRVSVRRRVIRVIADAAMARYDRWYMIAHSQGTVAAFNGLMETPYAWPGYFDKAGWERFRREGFGGPGRITESGRPTMPRRPVWVGAEDVAYRARVFAKFRGFLTLGSPLGKFAAIWPARVPISRIPAFHHETVWINVFDPVDPVSGVLSAYAGHPVSVCPPPQNIGYAAYWVLLLAHLQYVTWTGPGCLADGVGRWLLTGDAGGISGGAGRFVAGSGQAGRRTAAAWGWWVALFLALAAAGGWAVREVMGWIAPAGCGRPGVAHGWVGGALCWVTAHDYIWFVWVVVFAAVFFTALAGGWSSLLLFRGAADPEAAPQAGEPIADPDPNPPVL